MVLEREALLGGLDSLLGEAVWHGGRLVLVRGEAGIGKSTLVKAFTSGREGRVLWGTCDPVTPPRPLGPIFDMADQGSPGLRQALDAGDRHQVSSAFVGLLRADGGPRIAVIEDAQWADDATLDLLKVAGRRIHQLPALVVVTLRDDDVGPDHPLSTTLGTFPRPPWCRFPCHRCRCPQCANWPPVPPSIRSHSMPQQAGIPSS